jgi:hypothetical protein
MKVYVSSGSARWIGEAESESQAAIEFVSRLSHRGELGRLDAKWLMTSEQGFDSIHVRWYVPQLVVMAQRRPPG